MSLEYFFITVVQCLSSKTNSLQLVTEDWKKRTNRETEHVFNAVYSRGDRYKGLLAVSLAKSQPRQTSEVISLDLPGFYLLLSEKSARIFKISSQLYIVKDNNLPLVENALNPSKRRQLQLTVTILENFQEVQ